MPRRLAAAQEVADGDNIASHPRAISSGETGQLSGDSQCSSTQTVESSDASHDRECFWPQSSSARDRGLSAAIPPTHPSLAIGKRATGGATRHCKPPGASDQGKAGQASVGRPWSAGVRNAEELRRACFERLCIVGAVLWTSCDGLRTANGNQSQRAWRALPCWGRTLLPAHVWASIERALESSHLQLDDVDGAGFAYFEIKGEDETDHALGHESSEPAAAPSPAPWVWSRKMSKSPRRFPNMYGLCKDNKERQCWKWRPRYPASGDAEPPGKDIPSRLWPRRVADMSSLAKHASNRRSL